MPPDLQIGVGVFMDYVNVSGSGRMSIIDQQMQRILDPSRLAWYPYSAAETAIKAAVASTDPTAVLQHMVESAPEQMRSHYQEIAAGWQRWLTRHRCTLLPVRKASWTANGLTVKVRHHLGLRLPDGRTMAALPYMKQLPLTQGGANVALHIMEQLMDNILPAATSAVIDVRRAKLFTLSANTRRHRLDTWLRGEAAGYAAHWLASTA